MFLLPFGYSPIFQISLIYAFIGCPYSVDWSICIISINPKITYNITVPNLCQKDIWKSDRADPIEKLPSLSNIVGNSIGFQLYLLIYIWRNICPELIPWSIYLSASVLLLVCTGLAKFISHPVWGENKPLFDRVLGQTKALITTTVLSSAAKGIAFFLKGTQQEMSPIDGVLLWVR